MAQANRKPTFKPHTMSEKFKFHSDRVFKNRKPKGSHMTKAEQVAYSAGYVEHARQVARAHKFNLARDMGASKKDAQAIANNPRIHFNDRMGRFEKR